MKVRDFVHKALTEVIEGIQLAQKDLPNENGAFDPLISTAWLPEGSTRGHADKEHEIEFDLAITVGKDASMEVAAGFGFKLLGIQTGIRGNTEHSTVHRIKFSIPVRYPLMRPAKVEWNP